EITNSIALGDIRSLVNVSSLAALGSGPSGVAAASDGAVYVTGGNQVLKVQGGAVSVLAGDGVAGYVDGLGTAARFDNPTGIAQNPVDGSLIVADYTRHRIRRVTLAGVASLVAGTGVEGGTNGTGSTATFSRPAGVAVDAAGVIYVAEQGGHRVRRIALSSGDGTLPSHYLVTTLAGSGAAGFAEGNGTAASFNGPRGVAVDEDGNVYVADAGNYRVRVVRPTGQVTTAAGSGSGGATDGYGNVATFNSLYGVAALPDRGRGVSLVVADMNARTLRQLRLREGAAIGSSSNWIVQTLAGQNGVAGSTDGTGDVARFHTPRLVAAASSGTLYLADNGNSSIRRVVPAGGYFPLGEVGAAPSEPVVLANAAGMVPWSGGDPRPYLACPDLAAGATSEPVKWTFAVPAGVSAFEFTVTVAAATDPYSPPEAVNKDSSGGKGSPQVSVRTLAGSTTGQNGFVDGMGANARFRLLVGLTVDSDGVAYAADADNNAIRRIEPGGRVTTVAGSLGTAGHVNGLGNVAQLSYPCGVAVVPDGILSTSGSLPAGTDTTFLVVTDLDNDRVRLIRSPQTGWTAALPWEPWNPAFYQVATIAGDGTSGYNNGSGNVAQFAAPGAVAVGPGGIVYICERAGGSRVRTLRYTGGDPMVATNWQVGLLAGSTSGASGYVDATGSSAQFTDPRGITVGPDGTAYVADTYNHCIRKVTPDGVVTTLAGTNTSGYVDSSGTAARFYCPWAVAAGPDGYLFVADRYNYRIRRVSPTGVVRTVAGTGSSGREDGRGDTAEFADDLGIAVSPGGDVYVAEAECIRLVERIVSVALAGD
ncbi:hypothetical protein LLH23_05875, partial [bacterium]|nr:hypothetical protein [bacterium]